MAEEQAAHHLLNILEERGLNVDLDKVLVAFENESTSRAVAAWVDEYLKEETLLTREELELYQTLKKKGLLHQYEIEDEPIRPILDHEISSAIDSLQSSTAAIEEQCKVLEAQKNALMKLKALDKPNLDVEHARNERRRREGQERVRLDGAIEDVSVSINDQLTDTQREIDAEKSTLKGYLAERLASDDQVLSRLPGIVSQILTEPVVNEDEESIEQWCKAIVSFRTAEIKARVDTVYLKSLSQHSRDTPDEPQAELEERKAALQTELEDLHSEIASVAEMVVEHELRKPMMEMKERKERDISHARSAWLNYVLTTLNYMSKRLDTVTSQSNNIDEFQQALAQVNQAASKRMTDPHAEASTPSRRRRSSVQQSAFTPALKLKPSKSLDLPPTLQDALRHAGVSFNQDSIEALRETLIKTQLERDRKLRDHYSAAGSSAQEMLAERFHKADTDLRGIMDALFAHTPFQQVQLVSSQLEDRLKRMERELEVKDGELLDAEANELSLSDPKVRAFIAKHGR